MLPPEVRQQIWELALLPSEDLEIVACTCLASDCASLRGCEARLTESLPQHAALLTPGLLLFVCRKSRREALPWVKDLPHLRYKLCNV